jgi:hypothetical protein
VKLGWSLFFTFLVKAIPSDGEIGNFFFFVVVASTVGSSLAGSV